MQRVDQELSLELTESPINPAFIHMSAPLVNGYDPLFYLQINGEALWKWREFKMDLTRIFHALQDSLASIGYQLNSSSEVRVGTAWKGWLNKEKKPCLSIKIFQWSMTTQVSSKSEWPTHCARYKTVVRPFFRAPHLFDTGARQNHIYDKDWMKLTFHLTKD